jgi:hypothetical protein
MIITPVRETTGWERARDRVDHQLLAYRVTDAAVREHLIAGILEEARRHHAIEANRPPEEIAAVVTNRRVGTWIDELIGQSNESPALRFARGRTAVFLADLPEDWPELMLDASTVPAALRERVRTTYLEAGPDLTFTNMAPRPIDLGPISSVADGTWRTFARWPVLRGMLMSALFFSLLGTAFYLVRF